MPDCEMLGRKINQDRKSECRATACQWTGQGREEISDGPDLVGEEEVQRPWGRTEIGMLEQQPRDQSRHHEGREKGGGESEGKAGRALGTGRPSSSSGSV